MAKSFKEIADEAKNITDQQLSSDISSLTKLSQEEINSIAPAPLDKDNLKKLIQMVKDSAKSNEIKAETITNIDNGVSLLVSLLSKLI